MSEVRAIRKHTNGPGMVTIIHKGRTLFSGYVARGLYPIVIIAPKPDPIPRTHVALSKAARTKLHRIARLQRRNRK